ncbi:MAG: HEPN domain-containing protein [Clostridia bacterium]|nr:HEPN domain-containing protein [Clostridia bacterium]
MIGPEQEWMDQAEYDFSAAEAMFKARKYIYCVFMIQLALEKALKAVFVQRTGQAPPRTHKLVYLAELAQAALTEEQIQFLGLLDAVGPSARYPKDLKAAMKEYSRRIAGEHLARAREILQCVKNQVIPKP